MALKFLSFITPKRYGVTMTNAEYWTKELWSDNDQRRVLDQRVME